MRRYAFILSMLLSGAAALVYEIVWVRRLGDLLGQDVYAINIVLTVFFAGLGVGGWLFGRLADRWRGTIELYVILELVIAASAVAFDAALSMIEGLYTQWSHAEVSLANSVLYKGLACFCVLIIPTVAMGGTLTALVRHVITHDHQVTSGFSWLYGANTLGAATGVMLATFVLIPAFGVQRTMVGAIGLNVMAAGIALWASRRNEPADAPPKSPRKRKTREPQVVPPYIPTSPAVPYFVAFSTGFVSLGFEVLWTRGLSTRFISGVYSLAIILFVYLLCIAVGSLTVTLLDRKRWVTPASCAFALILAGLFGMLSPALMSRVPQTNELLSGDAAQTFWGFEFRQLLRTLTVMAASLFMFGLALPMIVRLATRDVEQVGASAGSIYFVNSIGAVVAPLFVGFWLMPALGLAGSFALLGGLLAVVGAFVVLPWAVRDMRRRAAAWLATVPLALFCVPAALTPDIRAWKSHPQAQLVDYREGVAAAVSVVDHPERGRVLQVNLGYTLGGSRGVFTQRRQALLPVLLQHDIESALVLGLGTGCTAGTVFEATRARTDALEIIPDVLPLIHYYDDINYKLLDRADAELDLRVLSVDARHFVRATPLQYDVVIGDLFEPWRRGVGAMYTREHFESVRRILSDRGSFWQWLPLYQLADSELKVIARTFCQVFEHVEVWWLSFNAEHPAVALVGANGPRTVEAQRIRSALGSGTPAPIWLEAGIVGEGPVLGSLICGRQTLVEYAGDGPLNTLDHPFVEFNAPRSLAKNSAAWARANIDRMFELADRADDDRRRAFPDPADATLADRYRIGVQSMIAAHAHQRAGEFEAAAGQAIRAAESTPEWGYPINAFSDAMVNYLLQQRLDMQFKRIVENFDRTESTRYFADYCRAQQAIRDNQPMDARRYLRSALRSNPGHLPSARLLQALEQRVAPPDRRNRR